MKVSKVTNPLTQPLKPQLTSPESSLVFYPQDLISPSSYANLSQTTGFPFGRNRPLPINLLKFNPYLSLGLRLTKHIAVMKSTSHVSASLTLVSDMLTFSPTYSPFHVNIAAFSTHPLQSTTCLNALPSQPYNYSTTFLIPSKHLSPMTPHLSPTYSLTSMQHTSFHASNLHSLPPSS